jgi:hypothetical protein
MHSTNQTNLKFPHGIRAKLDPIHHNDYLGHLRLNSRVAR